MKTSALMHRPLFIVFSLLFALAGCARASSPQAESGAAAVPASSGGGVAAVAPAAASIDRSLIVTMDVAITVDRVDQASAQIRSAVERAGGFVSDERASGGSAAWAQLELRVPAAEARSLRTSLDELGEITSWTEKVEDVTEQRADLEARLRNARVQEKRTLEILSGKTSSLSELVEAEKELARVRENVERLEAQERLMKSRIELATVRLSLVTKTTPPWETPAASLSRAGRSGVRGAAAIAVYGGMAFVTVAPTLLPIAAVVAAVVLALRRRRGSSPVVAGGC